MRKVLFFYKISLICFFLFYMSTCVVKAQEKPLAYTQLVSLFKQWRTFEIAPITNGVPDYTKSTFENRQAIFIDMHEKLKKIDTTNWPISLKIDWQLVNAEMNGYDFNYRILKPWERDPAFYKTIWTYKSDVPAHEGPTHHKVLDLWMNFHVKP